MKPALVIFIGLGVVGAVAWIWTATRPIEVKLVSVSTSEAESSILVSGLFEPADRAKITCEVANRRVREITTDLGKSVTVGQVLVRLDDEQERIALEKAQFQLNVAQLNLDKTLRQANGANQAERIAISSSVDPIELQRSFDTAVEALRASNARQTQSEMRQRKLLAGSRPEEIESAISEIKSARSTLTLKEIELSRVEKLVSEGAIAKSKLDEAIEAKLTAASALDASESKLRSLQTPRPEDAAEAEAAVKEAKAQTRSAERDLSAARQNLQKRRLLAAQLNSAQTDSSVGTISADSARIELTIAQTTIAQANRDLAKTLVRAPISGLITARDIHIGEIADANRVIFQIASLSSLRVKLEIDEKYVPALRVGMGAVVIPDPAPELKIPARVSEISSQSNTERGTVEVRLSFISNDPRLKADQAVSATIITMHKSNALTIPASSVIREGEIVSVATIESGKIRRKKVIVKALDNGLLLIESGLKQGDKILKTPRSASEGDTAVEAKSK